MSRIFILWVILFAMVFSRTAAAENPWVKFPSGNAAWTVEISSESKALRPVRVDVAVVDGTKRVRFTWSDGSVSERWNIAGLPVTFFQNPKGKSVKVRQNGSPVQEAADWAGSYDASAFAWIAAGQLQEKEPVKFKGVSCYHYQGDSVYRESKEEQPATIRREAWIDEKTLLPVALISGEGDLATTSIFKFESAPPPGPLNPPKEFAEAINYYKAVMGF